MQLTLYHGTDNYAAQQILRDNVYISCRKDIHYLGQGIYFYDNDSAAAKWIRVFYKGLGTILENEIVVNDEDVLDTRIPSHQKKAIAVVVELSKKKILALSNKNDADYDRKRRCFLFDAIAAEYGCKLLISKVITDNALWALSIPASVDLQYCVKDKSIIKKISLLRNVGVSIV